MNINNITMINENDLKRVTNLEIDNVSMSDYPTPNTNNELHKMQKELKELKSK